MLASGLEIALDPVVRPVVHRVVRSAQIVVGAEDTDSIAEEHVKHPVVPPALPEVREPRLVEEFEELEHKPYQTCQSDVTNYQHLDEPAEGVSTQIEVESLADVNVVGRGVLGGKDSAVVSVCLLREGNASPSVKEVEHPANGRRVLKEKEDHQQQVNNGAVVHHVLHQVKHKRFLTLLREVNTPEDQKH